MNKVKKALNELQKQFQDLELNEDELKKLSVAGDLTPRQSLFINYYILNGFNATEAIKKCGYTGKNATLVGHQILRRPGIREEVERRCAAFAQAKMATREMLTAKIYEMIQELDYTNTYDRNFMLKAIEQIAKLQGLYQPDSQVNIQTNSDKEITINIVKPNAD
jgi:phage terminase small subunit